ncbi:MAG: hydantoinase/oxoprolinase family protein [Chloroflexota bacterium]|nr:MAG: hydantoinase/oxoprolinase family protein [Chloroflexota bacterium]
MSQSEAIGPAGNRSSPGQNEPPKVGVDTGGTFTDFVWVDGDGRLQVHKELSTPVDPSRSILSGIDKLVIPLAASIVHGSTVATNALLERRGARTALIATAGFADVLAIGRQDRPDLYALVPRKPDPLVPRQWRFEVDERVTAEGQILRALDETDLARVVRELLADEIESVAVCLLFSFLRPEHERQIRAAIKAALPAAEQPIHVSLSSEILPEYREYERTATTVINAYVAPLMNRYLKRLEREVAPRSLVVMQSNGGIIGPVRASSEAARTVLSGPAGGVVGAMYVAERAGFKNIITFDMGGTSTDVALCPGQLPATSEGEIAGLPIRLPIIDIHTVGAGGGSLAYVDPGGALQVGPQSAGADPGPACYGRTSMEETAVPAGTAASRTTTTDANLLLGRLDVDHFLGGQMRLDEAAARQAVARLSLALGAESPELAAWGVIQVANANMERAIRRISVERGYDPRDFTLVAFGGAGPLHACDLAESLQIPRVLVPPSPGVLSALGMIVARPARDYSVTVMGRLEPDGADQPEWLMENFAAMRARAEDEMSAEGYGSEQLLLEERLDLRYFGQSYELTIAVEAGDSGGDISARFHSAHARRYGFERPDQAVQIVNLRLAATARMTPPALPELAKGPADAQEATVGRKQVWYGESGVESTLYDRARLRAGNVIGGPAIVFQYDTTTVILPEWTAEVDQHGNLLLQRLN